MITKYSRARAANDWKLLAKLGFSERVFRRADGEGAKLGVREMDSTLATFVRTIVVLVLAGSLVAWQGTYKSLPNLDARAITFLVLSGVATGASWLCYFHALKIGPASRVAPIDKLSVVFAVVLAAIFLGETLTWKGVLGVALMVGGALLVAL